MNNEPINDPLGLMIDENSSNSNLGASNTVGQAIPIRTQNSVNPTIIRTPSTASNAPATPASSVASSVVGNPVSSGNLINLTNDQVSNR